MVRGDKPYFLAIDLGTSGPKVAVVSQEGEIISQAIRKTELISIPPHGFEQKPSHWWKKIKEAIHECLSCEAVNRHQIKGISCTAQWSGCVPISKEGEPLRSCIIWMDSRGSQEIKNLNRGFLKLAGYSPWKLFHWIYKTGGAPSRSGKDTLAHILYIREQEPSIYQNTHKFLEPKDYLNFKLTGLAATSYDTSTLCWLTNSRNIHNMFYDPGLIRLTGIDRKKLPVMKPSTSILGKVTQEIASEFGISKETPVIVGSPDIQSAAIGSGIVKNYQANLYIGTSSWITCHVPYKKTSVENNIASLPSALPGKYLVCTEQETAGECLNYLKKILFTKETASEDIFKQLEAIAQESPPGSQNLIFTPWLNGERTPVDNNKIRAGFHNVSLHHNRSDFVRAVYEGVAYNSKWLLKTVEKFMNRSIDEINFIGGGAESDLWCQIHANVLNCTIHKVDDPRSANSRGAAWLAALALGYIEENQIPRLLKIKKTFKKEEMNLDGYEKNFHQFKNLYHAQRKICTLLNKTYDQ